MPDLGYKYVIILLVSVIILVVACTPKSRYSILSTIFDGVPPPTEYNTLVIGDTLGQVDSLSTLAMTQAIRQPKINYHPPFRDKDCASCHDEKHLGQLVAEEPQLCYQCHDNNIGKHSFRHGPAGAYCTSCHQPHKSEAKMLLLNDGEDLCFNCHDSDLVTENSIHENIKKDKCLDCHNPHSSENRFMLQKGACYSCHEDKIIDYSFLHGPVSANYCSTCHESHTSKNENLLVKTGQDLCLNCHDSSDIFKNAEHQELENKNCIQCHNPHGGENEFMLN